MEEFVVSGGKEGVGVLPGEGMPGALFVTFPSGIYTVRGVTKYRPFFPL
jgi:hypothetical protein